MRKVVYVIMFMLLLTIACTGPSREQAIKGQEAVKLYLAMNHDVQYSDKSFSGSDATAIADLVTAECPQGVGDSFVRTTIDSRASTLIIYSDMSGKNITCSVLKPKQAKQIVMKKLAEAPDNETIVTVNGQKITISQVQRALATLPESTPRDDNTVNLLLNSLINDELLRQEANEVEVTDKEIADRRAAIMAQANVTEEQITKNLAAQGLTMEDFEISVKEQTRLQKLLDERLLLKESSVSEEDARNYYLANPNQFLQSEQAVMRMILISSNGRTLDQGTARAQEVATKLNSTDFCELVVQYSDDAATKEKCGVYIVPRGVIDANLELASFSTPVNQTSVVRTNTGIYFVQTLQVQPAQVIPYNQIAGNVETGLRNAILQQRLNLYLSVLRAEADITSYLG
jgi:parvulin-like peptidyl-prolyl isomerase